MSYHVIPMEHLCAVFHQTVYANGNHVPNKNTLLEWLWLRHELHGDKTEFKMTVS